MSLPPLPLPEGVSSSYVSSPSSPLTFHFLSAGRKGDPLLLFIHGFPELSYSFRKILHPASCQGFFAVAPDSRGYGRTTGWDTRPYDECDLRTFSFTQYVIDMLAFVHALGYEKVHCVIGRDAGAVVASTAALSRPDVFERVVLMSHPFKGTKSLPLDTGVADSPHALPLPQSKTKDDPIQSELANLEEPRKPYKWYYASSSAASDLQGDRSDKKSLKQFLRNYFYLKSASWPGNKPHVLKSWTANEVAKMPYYYVMPLHASMRQSCTLELDRTGTSPQASESWLDDSALDVWTEEFSRTGFQGPLNFYRITTDPRNQEDMLLLAGRTIDVPCLALMGRQDWGSFQEPGALEGMNRTCSMFKGVVWVEDAGHFMEQEQPERVVSAILEFCRT